MNDLDDYLGSYADHRLLRSAFFHPNETTPLTGSRYPATFIQLLALELQRVDDRFTLDYERFQTRLVALRRALHAQQQRGSVHHDLLAVSEQSVGQDECNAAFREELVDVSREMHFLQQFAGVNLACTTSLLREELGPARLGRERLDESLRLLASTKFAAAVKDGSPLTALIADAQHLFARFYTQGDAAVARYQLLVKREASIQWRQVYIGFFIGAAVVLAVWDCIVEAKLATHHSWGLRAFRGLGLVLGLYWTFGLVLLCLRRSRVNFPLLLNFPASHFHSNQELFTAASFASVVMLASFLSFLKLQRQQNALSNLIPTGLLLLIVALLLQRLLALPAPQERSLRARCTTALRAATTFAVFATGFGELSFRSALIADVLTSSVKILADLTFSSCCAVRWLAALHRSLHGGDRVVNVPEAHSAPPLLVDEQRIAQMCESDLALVVPIVMCWPLWLRMIQNLRQLVRTGRQWPFAPNVTKYALSHTVTVFTFLHPDLLRIEAWELGEGGEVSAKFSRSTFWQWLFLSAFFGATASAAAWDILVDWGLFKSSACRLRERRMVAPRSALVYIAAAVGDVIARFGWTFTLIVPMALRDDERAGASALRTLSTALPFVELARRGVWAVLRLENEHLHNTRGYRSISFVPLYFDTPLTRRKRGADKGGEIEGRGRWIEFAEAATFVGLVLGIAMLGIVQR